MSTRRELLTSGAAIAAALLVGCSDRDAVQLEPVTIDKSEIPVGGGVVRADAGIVITQPEEGVFMGFSSLCTHQGCDVSEVREDGIYCACHGSLFSITNGSPTVGPATAPLRLVELSDNGDSLSHTP